MFWMSSRCTTCADVQHRHDSDVEQGSGWTSGLDIGGCVQHQPKAVPHPMGLSTARETECPMGGGMSLTKKLAVAVTSNSSP
jgi:hypothetical protein